MSEWRARRFWKEARVVAEADGFGIALDDRPVRTPGKLPLRVPTRALARALAAEWDAQEGRIDPGAMPLTRAANSAIEKVAPQHEAVAAMLAAYGDTDLTCYRADRPEGLVRQQSEAWDPLLDWAASRYGARLIPVQGVMHQPQNATALQRLEAPVLGMTAFQLAGFHDLVSLSSSLIIGLAAVEGLFPADDLWARSRIDEDWQIHQWGEDAEAARAAATEKRAFLDGLEFFRLSSQKSVTA